jgi:hypothetical protein
MLALARQALICAGLSTLACTALAADFGRTVGAFEVRDGSALYTVPVWTPPGPNGLTPSISLRYSSSEANGLAGVGWSLIATSSIERCFKTSDQDTHARHVEYLMTDRFCLDGKRLRSEPSTYGTHLSTYFTEVADFSRTTAYGTAGNGPEYFIVESKEGLKYEYGRTSNARVFPGLGPVSTTPLRWMLNKVIDRSGNTYTISYLNSEGFAVPDVISWTPVNHGSTSYRYEAKFNYSSPRSTTDSYLGVVGNFGIRNQRRLESIQIKSAGVVKRKYRLTYDTSSVTSRSRLRSVKDCADDAEQNCLLPISFNYQTGVSGVTAGSGASPATGITNLLKGRHDFNGDGKHDLTRTSAPTG